MLTPDGGEGVEAVGPVRRGFGVENSAFSFEAEVLVRESKDKGDAKEILSIRNRFSSKGRK